MKGVSNTPPNVQSTRSQAVPSTAGWVPWRICWRPRRGEGSGWCLASRVRSQSDRSQWGSGRATIWAVARPQDPRLSFNEAAEIYDRVRPSYPAVLFDALFDLLPSKPEIVEVGPGTGQATKNLLARGASVRAVEIGPALAAILRANLTSDRLDISVGRLWSHAAC